MHSHYTFFYKHQLNFAQPQYHLIENSIFLGLSLTTPYDYRLEVLFKPSLFIWYIDLFLKPFSF